MDGLGEVIIGNKIYSARYAQPPRAVFEQESDGKKVIQSQSGAVSSDATVPGSDAIEAASTSGENCSWLHRVRQKGALITTDLDELPVVEEPDYINLRVRSDSQSTDEGEMTPSMSTISKVSASSNIFTSSYGREENIYEEINELQRRLALEKQSVAIATRTQQHLSAFQQESTSLVDEVMDEVARVRLGHNIVLNQLNLDLEHFLKPQTPEPSPPLLEQEQQKNLQQDFDGADQIVKNRSRSTGEGACDKASTVFSTPPTGRLPRKFISHNRSNSSVSFTMSQLIGAGERSLVRCESLDFAVHEVNHQVHRRPSVTSRDSTSTSSSVASSNRSDTRQSIRNLHQGLQHGIQGLADWTEKCGQMLAKRSKKVIAFVNKGKHLLCPKTHWSCGRLLGAKPSE